MTDACRLVVTENMERPNHSPARQASAPGHYEREHGECQVSGSVAVAQGGRWQATLAVPTSGNQSQLLSIERLGPIATGAPTVEEVALVIPPGEIDAVVALVVGIVEHARQEGLF